MKLLAPYKALFKQFGIDMNSIDDSSISATNAKVMFAAGCDTLLSELANASGEIAAGQGTLTALIAQLQSSLAQLESSKNTILDSFDLAGQLTKDNIALLLEGQNIDMPAGYIEEGSSDLMVTVGDNISGIDDLKQLVIADTGLPGVDPVRLGDVADISYVSSGGETYAKVNGEDALFLTFMKQSDASTAKVADNINQEFTKLEGEYDGLSFDVLSDQGEYIDMAINAVLKNILLGALLAILILLYFLRDWKPTLVTALAIPISFIFAIVLMYFTGVTLNVISLAGLAVGVGMLVDNSIVVIENIYRLRSEGYSAVKAAYMGTRQVAGALTASTLTTIFVFVPIVFVHGISRELFTDMALTVAYSLLASLIIAVTMVPALGHALFDNIKNESVLARGSRSIANFRKVVEWALGHKAVVLGLAVAMLVFSVGMLAGRGFEFMPGMATSRVTATVTAPDDMSKADTFSACDKISEAARGVKGVDAVGHGDVVHGHVILVDGLP
jgi:multidrug efflux pump subunit AcrB